MNSFISWSSLLETGAVVVWVVRKFSTFYSVLRFIIILARAHRWTYFSCLNPVHTMVWCSQPAAFRCVLCSLHTFYVMCCLCQFVWWKFFRNIRKRPLGRPGRRWKDGIEMDFREIGWVGVEWIHLAQDRDHWWALVSAVMNLWILAPRSWLVN
jgi:hypothetical protein